MHASTISFHTVPIDIALSTDTLGRPCRGVEPGLSRSAGENGQAESTTDGRRIRRVRNRDRVVEEFIAFARNTGEAPDTDQLAEASRLSVRSIYRYFATHEDLFAAVAERLAEHAAIEFDPGDAIHADRCARISRLVDNTLRFHHHFGPAVQLVSTQQRRGNDIDVACRRIHESSLEQIEALLGPELAADEHGDDILAILGVCLAVDGLTLLVGTFPGQSIRIRDLLHRHIDGQLAPALEDA